jgi:hypothetical protein
MKLYLPLALLLSFFLLLSPSAKAAHFSPPVPTCPVYYDTFSVDICSGDSIVVGESVYNSSGTYYDILLNVYGCDSNVTTILTVHELFDTTITMTGCSGHYITLDGNNYDHDSSWSVHHSSVYGCDSTYNYVLSFSPARYTNDSFQLCPGAGIRVGTHFYRADGNYSDTLVAANGCDSIVNTVLNHYGVDSTYINTSICSNDTFRYGSIMLSDSGNYAYRMTNAHGCDSILRIHLSTIRIFDSISTYTPCYGDTFSIDGHRYTSNAIYYRNFTAHSGCDSIYEFHINFKPLLWVDDIYHLCEGDTVYVFSHKYFRPGHYFDTAVSYQGCDSIIHSIVGVTYIDKRITKFTENTLMADQLGASYQWVNCANHYDTISGEQARTFMPPHSGLYACVLQVFGCKDTSDCFEYDQTGIAGINENNLQVQSVVNMTEDAQWHVYHIAASEEMELLDVRGNKIVTIKGSEFPYTLRGMASGVYYWHLKSSSRIAAGKLLLIN